MSSMLWLAAAATVATPVASAEQVLERARSFYAVEHAEPETICPDSTDDEIVVCRQIDDPDQYRVPSDTDRGVVKDAVPRAPDLEPKYGGVVVAKGCFIPPCPRPMPLMIDLKSIPEAPPGSDADRIARGEKAP